MNDIEFFKDYSYFQEDVKTNINFNTTFKGYPQLGESISFGGFAAKINVKDSSNDYSFGVLKPKFIYATQTKINEISNIIENDWKVKQWMNHINEYNKRLPLLKEELDIDLANLQSKLSSVQEKEEINKTINIKIKAFRYRQAEVFKSYLRDWSYVIGLIETNFKIDELNINIEGLRVSFDSVKNEINKLDSRVSELDERVGKLENSSNINCANSAWLVSSATGTYSLGVEVFTKTTKVIDSFEVIGKTIPVVGNVLSAVSALTASFCGIFGK